jgi:Flp pilus assembly pilin Flp
MRHPGLTTPRRRRGATAMEYVFVASLILIAAITAIGYFGQTTKASIEQSSDAIEKATQFK